MRPLLVALLAGWMASATPPVSDSISVEQRGFGYRTPQTPQTYLETEDIGECIGVYIRSGTTRALAHIDRGLQPARIGVTQGPLDQGRETQLFLNALRAEHLISDKLDLVAIITSDHPAPGGIERVERALAPYHVRRLEHWRGGYRVDVRIGDTDQPIWIETTESSARDWRVILERKGLLNMNTGVVVE